MSRREEVARTFGRLFGGEPELWARAPGRVDLMGSHTDYNRGLVLTMAISRDTWIAARPNGCRRVRVYSANLDESDCFSLDPIAKSAEKSWSNYLRGVASVLSAEALALSGFDAVVHSTVPVASGLSSSAALECATAIVFQQLGGWQLSGRDAALLCQRAENEFVGVNCGVLDQFSSFLGEQGCALLLDCGDLSTRRVAIADGIRVVICDTRAARRLLAGEYAERRRKCEIGAALVGARALGDVAEAVLEEHAVSWAPDVRDRCRFIVGESLRVAQLARALADGDRDAIGALTLASFEGARDLFQICSPPMLAMMDAMAAAPGVIGARQAGAGFGGCLVAFVAEEETTRFAEAVRSGYERLTGQTPDVYVVTPAAGAGLLGEDEA